MPNSLIYNVKLIKAEYVYMHAHDQVTLSCGNKENLQHGLLHLRQLQHCVI